MKFGSLCAPGTTLAVLGIGLFVPAPAQSGAATAVQVRNEAPAPRAETVLASVPFAAGELPCPAGEVVLSAQWRDAAGERRVPAVPLLRWPDGSIAVLQVHANVRVPARGSLDASVAPCVDARGAAAVAPPAVTPSLLPSPLPLWTELEDPWGRVYTARLEPDLAAGADGVQSDSGAVRVQRFHSRLRAADGSELFALRAWLRSYAGERRGELTLLLDNTGDGGRALGPVRFRSFRLVVSDPQLRTLPMFAAENLLAPPVERQDGGYVQPLLGPAQSLYLGDQTGKAFRLQLFADSDEVDDDLRRSARWAALRLWACAEEDRVRATGAFGAHGGPAPATGDEAEAAGAQWWQWQQRADFGPFGGFGDPIGEQRIGVARNGDSALHNLLRWRSAQLALAAEAMVLQQPLRPTPGRAVALPAATAAYRFGIQAGALRQPHGFTAPDYEHFSVLLLYDWYWLTGDPLARHELARLGRGLRDLLAALPFTTSRGEGCCLQSGALIARATGDRELLQLLLQRCRQQLLPALAAAGDGICIAQPPLPEVLGDDPFDAPWQMALLLRGLHALYVASGDAELATAAVRVAEAMAGPGWVDGQGPKYAISARDRRRFLPPVDASVAVGIGRIELGAFVLAGELAARQGDAAAAARFARRGDWLLAQLLPPDAPPSARAAAAADAWLQVALDRRREDR